MNLELREAVAEAVGYECTNAPTPLYELSCDAIMAEFTKNNWGWGVETIRYNNLVKYSATSGLWDIEVEAETPSIALCKLYLAIHATVPEEVA